MIAFFCRVILSLLGLSIALAGLVLLIIVKHRLFHLED